MINRDEQRLTMADLFKPDDDSAFVLRVIAAANDVRSSVRVFASARSQEVKGSMRRSEIDGDQFYSFRLTITHLQELRDFLANNRRKPKHPHKQFFATRTSPEAAAAKAMIEELIEMLQKAPLGRLLEHVRHGMGAHYDHRRVLSALRDLDLEKEPITFSDANWIEQHWDATDVIFWESIAGRVHKLFGGADREEALGLAMDAVANAGARTFSCADALMALLYDENAVP
ncbi:MAG: hypothetical protein IPG45_18180 [Deltaproteobacteria bacterium]|nr:hypothetical protein [Deltaproteobacteria bacterium]